LKYGEVWEDPLKGHKVGVLDATKINDVLTIMGNKKAKLIINDPPYKMAREGKILKDCGERKDG